jgi:zinc transport system ATP-binding protein
VSPSGPERSPAAGAVGLAVEYQNVSYTYGGSGAGLRPALEGVTLSVREGERLGILGPNGGGKSTLLKLTLGLLRGGSGAVRVFGLSPEEARRRRLIGYVPQKVEAEMSFPLSARQVVEMSAALGHPAWRQLPGSVREAVDEALALVDASALADRPVGKLSGGQVQRVMIARALATRPRLLLLDEPTVGIDVAGQQRFADLLRLLHQRLGLTIVVVSHDLRTIAAGSDRVACLSRTLHSHMAPAGLSPQVLAEVFSHDVAAIFGDLHVDAHLAAECPETGGPAHGGTPPSPRAHTHGPSCDHHHGEHA